jgi:hypothetical protein
MKIVRYVLAPLLGIIVFMVGVSGFEAIGHAIYPPPVEIAELSRAYGDAMFSGDSERLAEVEREMTPVLTAWIAEAPLGPLLAVVLSWIGGGLIGALTAAAIAPTGKFWFAILIGAFDVLGIVMVTSQFSHPVWMPLVGVSGTVVVTVGVGLLLGRVSSARDDAPRPT